MSNEYSNMIKKSIEQYRQKMIHLYMEMDSDNNDFEETLQAHLSTFVQTIKKVLPLSTVDKWSEKIAHIHLKEHQSGSHIEVIKHQNQQYIDDIFDDIFDDTFFNLGDELEMDDLLSVDNVIQNIFNIDILPNATEVVSDLPYTLSENIDKYLEQFSTPIENINTQNQEIDR